VIAAARKSKDVAGQRSADFLDLRRQGQSVTDIAKAWSLSRECVSRTVSRKALLLVTDRLVQFGKASLAARSLCVLKMKICDTLERGTLDIGKVRSSERITP
jgi:hypothetical protein